MNLTKTEALYVFEITKNFVVNEDKNLVFAAFWILLSCLENLNYGQKLFFMSLVLSFCRSHFLKKVSYWILLTKIRLGQSLIYF